MDGFQVLEAVKGDARLAAVPVILLSSLSRTGLKVRGLELGADDYVVKPFDMAELLALIAEEQSESSAKMERLTEKLIRLTWGLFWLTIALAFVAAVQIYVMLK